MTDKTSILIENDDPKWWVVIDGHRVLDYDTPAAAAAGANLYINAARDKGMVVEAPLPQYFGGITHD